METGKFLGPVVERPANKADAKRTGATPPGDFVVGLTRDP